jgi:HSP20 family molecular chaperone IbpA
MKYNIKDIEVEVNENLLTIKKNKELVKAETYSTYNEAQEEYKKVIEQVNAYVNK